MWYSEQKCHKKCIILVILCPLILPVFSPWTAVSGPEDVALYVGIVAVALCLTLLLIVVVLVYRRKKEGLDADVADSSILTTGFQPVGIKPTKPGVWLSEELKLPQQAAVLSSAGRVDRSRQLACAVHVIVPLFI